eukprot:UN00476
MMSATTIDDLHPLRSPTFQLFSYKSEFNILSYGSNPNEYNAKHVINAVRLEPVITGNNQDKGQNNCTASRQCRFVLLLK